MAAMFGERVLARLPTTNGEDRFRPGIWLGKTDRADFHIVATVDGLRWTRTIRRLPIAYDAETLANARTWPWNVQNQRHCWQKFQVSHYHLTWLLQSVLRRDVKLLNVDANHLLYLHPFNKMVIKEDQAIPAESPKIRFTPEHTRVYCDGWVVREGNHE